VRRGNLQRLGREIINKVDKFLKKLDTFESTSKGLGFKGEDPKIFRKRKPKECYCGNHSCGKEIFFYEKNKRLYYRKRIQKYVIRQKEVDSK